ncbi:hypothetical protein [Bifidobacterium canis]|uniref:hypothetical protein n=1 Tax=Bifidobacterium canis TaxID=2610880 RepID=UPI001FEAB4DA|nr:hypothetical protein [Bifidobacterium canis]
MTVVEIIVSIVVGIGCFVLGVFLGALPIKRAEITEEQNKYQQLGGILACAIVVILMLLSMDVASWVSIGTLAVGVAISYIPAIRRVLLNRFPILQPAQPSSPLRRVKRKNDR